MKNKETEIAFDYESPKVEIIEVEIENGFAGSLPPDVGEPEFE